jgi:hypothetical protein
MFTRFHDDPCRIAKQLQQSTDQGRWILDVPGNGENPAYMADPHIRIQTWGGNLMSNTVNVESELRGVGRTLLKNDCLGKNNYKNYNVSSYQLSYPTCNMYTEESRAIMPAWTARDLEQVDWYTLPLDPQENVCIPFHNNVSTRILERDNSAEKQVSNYNISTENLLPLPLSSEMPQTGKYKSL